MYQRLMNKLDIDILESELQGEVNDEVLNRIREQIDILDNAYGTLRGTKDMVDTFCSLGIKSLMKTQ